MFSDQENQLPRPGAESSIPIIGRVLSKDSQRVLLCRPVVYECGVVMMYLCRVSRGKKKYCGAFHCSIWAII